MRVFTGISLSAAVSQRLGGVIAELERSARANWSPVENLHVTLKFIGTWPEERLAELEGAMQSVRPGPAFRVRVAQLGYFPNPHRPHSLFAGVAAGPELGALAKAVDQAAAAIGIKAEEREYRPHITLARIKDHSQVRGLRGRIAEMADLEFGEFEVRSFHLYESRTGQQGSVYSKLATYDLEREKEIG
ncbi:MAG TPA: RNA 2',3'-cyclic phosphodiesterase [Bryobacteraceae bacterium]|nr:RNA 2',3'-cyclic phosphodiesterase [Bryobacteraceae bacterium]